MSVLKRSRWRAVVGVACAAVVACGLSASAQNRLRHRSGQSVTPSYEGWFQASDGTFNLVFGFFNRNFDETVLIPVGPDNRIEPGPADQGQPTVFDPQRHVGVFVVNVPDDFGEKVAIWTLTTRNETIAIPGHLRPGWALEALRELTTGEMPPALRLEPAGRWERGPAGATVTRSAVVGQPLPMPVWVVSEPDAIEDSEGPHLVNVAWSRYRGPAPVVFREADRTIEGSGEVRTHATFSVPGEYVVRVLVGRAATSGCCWTNGYVHVTVGGESD